MEMIGSSPAPMHHIVAVVGAGTMGSGIAHIFTHAGYPVLHCTHLRTRCSHVRKPGYRSRHRAVSYQGRSLRHPRYNPLSAGNPRLEHQRHLHYTPCCRHLSSRSSHRNALLQPRPHHAPRRVGGLQTTQTTFDVVHAYAMTLGKAPIEVHDAPGFVSNRVLMPMINEAILTLTEGTANAAGVDRIFELGMAHPMGPLKLADFIGLDVCLDILRVLHEGFGDSKYRPLPAADSLVDAGWFGRKSGRGFYTYEPPPATSK